MGLEPDDRALLILRYMYDFEATELAAMTGTAIAITDAQGRLQRRGLTSCGAAGAAVATAASFDWQAPQEPPTRLPPDRPSPHSSESRAPR